MIKRQDGKYENKNTGEVIEEKDYFKWVKEIGECDEAYNNLSQVEKNIIDSDSEKSYREGYHHGFEAACKNPDIKVEEVREWRYGRELIAPPGSPRKQNKVM